ncbi:hypothetical protein B566_EDAN019105 [Ephemera danica]|nr:hypothetical protein B566_EDAN019105 [Ephemera danica]
MNARAQARAPKKAAPLSSAADSRRIQVRRSGVHGKGVFALRPIAAGEKIIEYTGERIDWPEALRRHPHDKNDPHHTFYFSLDSGQVIDALYGGNASRWINHACEPNCEADEADGRVHIKALRDLHPGEELFYDYGLRTAAEVGAGQIGLRNPIARIRRIGIAAVAIVGKVNLADEVIPRQDLAEQLGVRGDAGVQHRHDGAGAARAAQPGTLKTGHATQAVGRRIGIAAAMRVQPPLAVGAGE